MASQSRTLVSVTVLLSFALPAATRTQPPASWLDRPVAGWVTAGQAMPRARAAEEPLADVIRRCLLTPPRSSAAEQVRTAGWIPFWNFGKPLVRGDVEIIGGMVGADGMCRPVAYNLFVFVGGRFAGTLSPVAMTSRLDGASGVVSLEGDGVTVEFARYRATDPLCCPSSRVTVRYRVDRAAADPIVVPIEIAAARPAG
jgi:LppP/LprE lipoprotein